MDRYVIPSIFGKDIGIIVEGKNGIQFQYNNEFDGHALPLSPLLLPYDKERIYTLHDAMAFNGLPGIFNDSLPDKFGNILMNEYFSTKYGTANRVSLIDKLLYIGSHGMGAIEYSPALNDVTSDGVALRKYITEVRGVLEGKTEDVLQQFMQHPSPGGARPKASIMWDKENDSMRVGNSKGLQAKEEAWIVKFDETGREDTLIEYCYMHLAKVAGIDVPLTEIIRIGKENHFAIKRFDRTDSGDKLHMATLAGLLHLDFNTHVSTSYEKSMGVAFTLTQDYRAVKELFRRMVFNVIGRNCDDHSKNTSFVMDSNGEWKLSPAYDLIYSYGPATYGQHRMSIAKKIDHITIEDLAQCGYKLGLEPHFMKETIDTISDLFAGIYSLLLQHGVSEKTSKEIQKNIRQFSISTFPKKLKNHKNARKRTGVDVLTRKILKDISTKK